VGLWRIVGSSILAPVAEVLAWYGRQDVGQSGFADRRRPRTRGRKRWLPVTRALVNGQYYLPQLNFCAVANGSTHSARLHRFGGATRRRV
jgi:hypothetical protein